MKRQRSRAAVHEAGHAVAAAYCGYAVERVCIRGVRGGYVLLDMHRYPANIWAILVRDSPANMRDLYWRQAINRAFIMASGPMARAHHTRCGDGAACLEGAGDIAAMRAELAPFVADGELRVLIDHVLTASRRRISQADLWSAVLETADLIQTHGDIEGQVVESLVRRAVPGLMKFTGQFAAVEIACPCIDAPVNRDPPSTNVTTIDVAPFARSHGKV